MKRYEFHSSLPPELVFSRLAGWAKPPDLFAQGDGTFRYKRKKDCFWLTYTGTIPANGFIPFCGEVRPEGGGSVITGGFFAWRTRWKPMTAIWAVMYLPVSMLGVPLWAYLFMFALGALVGTGFSSLGQKAFFKEYQRAVLEFIERHLLE